MKRGAGLSEASPVGRVYKYTRTEDRVVNVNQLVQQQQRPQQLFMFKLKPEKTIVDSVTPALCPLRE